MGMYVHYSVCFSADSDYLPTVTPLIQEWIAHFKGSFYEKEFLKALLEVSYYSCGPKGELFHWGIVGNYVEVEVVVNNLKEFFHALIKIDENYIYKSDHIIFFEEWEQLGQAFAYEIYLTSADTLKIKKHELPFCWNQG